MDQYREHYAKQNKLVREGQILHKFHLNEVSNVVTVIEAENMIVVATGWEGREMGKLFLKRYKVSVMPDACSRHLLGSIVSTVPMTISRLLTA